MMLGDYVGIEVRLEMLGEVGRGWGDCLCLCFVIFAIKRQAAISIKWVCKTISCHLAKIFSLSKS